MAEIIEITDDDLIEWDKNIARFIRLSDYQKMKKLLQSIDTQLEPLKVDDTFVPKNARQGSIQYHNKVKKVALARQRERVIKKMSELEALIKQDIDLLKQL